MKKYFAAAALLMMMAACGSAGQDKKLEGTTWKLARMEAIPAAAVGKEADFFTLEFNAADTMVAGRTNCNRFFGKYELKGKELELKNLGMTRMACPDMQYEDAFVKMLDEVDRFEIKGAELTLFDDHKALAVFKAVEKSLRSSNFADAEYLRQSPTGAAVFCIRRMIRRLRSEPLPVMDARKICCGRKRGIA